MFTDQIDNMSKLVAGDFAYVYPYQKRKEIDTFDDLTLIQVQDVVPVTKAKDDLMASGLNRKIVEGKIDEQKILGIVEYIRTGDIIKTSEGDKFINFYTEGKQMHRCLRKQKPEHEYCRFRAIFQIDKSIEIKVEPYDLVCYNQDNLCRLIDYTKISHPRLCNGYISFFLNGEEVYFNHFGVYVKDIKLQASDAEHQIFKWACENKNPINDVDFDFQKIFSLKLVNYELLQTKLSDNRILTIS